MFRVLAASTGRDGLGSGASCALDCCEAVALAALVPGQVAIEWSADGGGTVGGADASCANCVDSNARSAGASAAVRTQAGVRLTASARASSRPCGAASAGDRASGTLARSCLRASGCLIDGPPG